MCASSTLFLRFEKENSMDQLPWPGRPRSEKPGFAIPIVQQSSRRGGEMLKPACVLMITLALVFPLNEIAAGESKELSKQRQEAQKERQEKKKQRATEIAEATKSFQEFARNLKAETQGKVKELDVEFELKGVGDPEYGRGFRTDVARKSRRTCAWSRTDVLQLAPHAVRPGWRSRSKRVLVQIGGTQQREAIDKDQIQEDQRSEQDQAQGRKEENPGTVMGVQTIRAPNCRPFA
jgi:hypothetical protein